MISLQLEYLAKTFCTLSCLYRFKSKYCVYLCKSLTMYLEWLYCINRLTIDLFVKFFKTLTFQYKHLRKINVNCQNIKATVHQQHCFNPSTLFYNILTPAEYHFVDFDIWPAHISIHARMISVYFHFFRYFLFGKHSSVFNGISVFVSVLNMGHLISGLWERIGPWHWHHPLKCSLDPWAQ